MYGKPVMWAINEITKGMDRQIGLVEIQWMKSAGMPQRGDHAAEEVVGVLSCSQKEVIWCDLLGHLFASTAV